MRRRRRALSPDERSAADRALCAHIRGAHIFRAAERIGVYIAFDGEPDLTSLYTSAANRRKHFFVPVLEGLEMHFAPFPRDGRLARNFFGILEPESTGRVDVRTLDLILTPLVAFDSRGGRLGVGRGYYDRRFAFLRTRRAWRRPKLLGVGYSFQEIPPMELEVWDVQLWGVVTEQGLRRFAGAEPT